jgi:hypothetical protein
MMASSSVGMTSMSALEAVEAMWLVLISFCSYVKINT